MDRRTDRAEFRAEQGVQKLKIILQWTMMNAIVTVMQ